MIRESHRDASLVDVQSRKHIIVPRDKCLASHRSASLIQWLKFQPLYRLLGTRGEPRHPSYKSQEYAKTTGVAKSPAHRRQSGKSHGCDFHAQARRKWFPRPTPGALSRMKGSMIRE